MAGRSATLNIRIVSDASDASRGFAEAESRIDRFQGGLDRASVAAGGVIAGLGAVASQAYDAASQLEQSTGAIGSVFGNWADDIERKAADAAQAVGLSAAAYQESAALLGSQLQTMGFDTGQAVAGVDALTVQAADLAATFGGTTQEALDAFSSALKGERDPIERYGIALSQAAIDSQIAAMGLDTSTDAAARNAQAQATMALITEQSAASQGAFAREAGTSAGQTQRAAAEWENAKAALGEVLLPVVSEAAAKFSELLTWVVQNKDAVLPLIGIVGGLAAGIILLNAGMRAYAVVQGVVNAVMNASPLMRLVMIITGVVGAVILMYQKFQWFRDLVGAIGGFVMGYFNAWKTAIQWVVDKLSWVGDAWDSVSGWFSAPQTVALTPVAAGSAAGLFGAAAAPAAMRGAPLISGAGGGVGPSAGSGPAPVQPIQVVIQGALDPVAVGRQVERVLADYAAATGRELAVTVGRGR